MGASILDRVVFPTEVKNGNPLSTRLHQLARFQVLKLGSSPNLYKLSHGDLLPRSRSFSQLLPAHGARPEFSSGFNFASDSSERFSYPAQESSGNLGYFGNRGSTAESVQR